MISRENRTPLYSQLVKELQNQIETEMKPNDKLPSEKEIGEIYAVSRTTVRLAMDELEKCGYIYRLQGKGSFVSSIYLNVKNSFEVIDERRFFENEYPGTYTCKESLYGVTSVLPNNMQGISKDMEFIRVQYIISADKEKDLMVDYYLNLNIFRNIEHQEISETYIDTICGKNNIFIKRIGETYQVITAYQELSDKLHISENTPILRIDKTCYDSSNELAIVCIKHIVTSRYKYHNFLEVKL